MEHKFLKKGTENKKIKKPGQTKKKTVRIHRFLILFFPLFFVTFSKKSKIFFIGIEKREW